MTMTQASTGRLGAGLPVLGGSVQCCPGMGWRDMAAAAAIRPVRGEA
jgi:hypothetical protein